MRPATRVVLAASGATNRTAAVAVSGEEEPLPDFQPTERLPADSAVAFPTDI